MGEASVSSSRLPYTYMEYSLKLIREVYGDIFGKSAEMEWGSLSNKRGEAFQISVGKPLGNPQKINMISLKCILGKTWEKHTGKPYVKLQKIK